MLYGIVGFWTLAFLISGVAFLSNGAKRHETDPTEGGQQIKIGIGLILIGILIAALPFIVNWMFDHHWVG